MTEKLSQEELLKYLDGHIPSGWQVHPAYDQIRKLIQGKVSREWLHKKIDYFWEELEVPQVEAYELLTRLLKEFDIEVEE